MKFLCIKGHQEESEKTTHRMGNIFTNYIFDKGLVSKMYEALKMQEQKQIMKLKMCKECEKTIHINLTVTTNYKPITDTHAKKEEFKQH